MISDFRPPNIKKSVILSDLCGRIFHALTRQLYKSSIPLFFLTRCPARRKQSDTNPPLCDPCVPCG